MEKGHRLEAGVRLARGASDADHYRSMFDSHAPAPRFGGCAPALALTRQWLGCPRQMGTPGMVLGAWMPRASGGGARGGDVPGADGGMLGAIGLRCMPRRRTTLRGTSPDAEPLAISLLCGTPAGSRRRVSDSTAWSGRLFGVTPLPPGNYGTGQFPLGGYANILRPGRMLQLALVASIRLAAKQPRADSGSLRERPRHAVRADSSSGISTAPTGPRKSSSECDRQ